MTSKKIIENHTNEVILIIVAHTDDETIAMGGTIAKHVSEGDEVFAISMTDGVGSRIAGTKENVQTRKDSAIRASKILGFSWAVNANFPDNSMDSVPLLEVIKIIEAEKKKINPTIIYTHSSADLNIDHRVVAEATLTAFRPQPNETWKEIRAFEVASATDYSHEDVTTSFIPNLYISISAFWDKKIQALEQYNEEIREEPHSRSFRGIENLANYRGNQVGLNQAEAFQILRKIER